VQGDDQIILSYFPDKVWTFGLYRAGWKLDTNQTYYLWYNVDGPADAQGVTKRPVDAAEPTRIFFEVSDVEDIIDKIENGSTLNIQFRGVTGPAENYSYSLDQARAAFEATRKCVSDRSGGTEAAAPADQGGTVSKEGGGKGQTEASGSGETTRDGAPTAGPAEGGNTPQAPLPTLGLKKIEDLQVSGWTAAAFALDDGTFTHCAIKAEYQNGATLGFALTAEGELVLAVQHSDWTLAADASVPISYTLKAGDPPYASSGQGQAVDTNVVMTNMGGVEDLGDTLKAAHEVDVQIEGKDLSFDTSDIGPAYDAINQCAAKHASDPAPTQEPAAKKVEAPAGKAGPDAGSSEASEEQATPPAADAPSTDTQVASTGNAAEDDAAFHTEAAGYTTALLIRSGYPNHIIVNGDEVPEAFRSHRAMWKLADLVGVTDMVSGSVDEIKSNVFSSDTKDCAGEATTAVDGVSGAYEHVHTVCKKGDGSSITVHYLVIPRDAGGSYMLSFIDTGDGTSAGAIAEKVYSTAVPM
jgi:hypothetical protein